MIDIDYPMYERPRTYGLFLIVFLLGLVAAAAGLWLAGGVEVDPTSILLLVLVTLFGIFIFSLASRDDPEGAILFQVLMLAWVARLIGLGAKLYIFYAVVGGQADAAAYHSAGESIAQSLMAGQWPDLKPYGTSFVELVTGLMYVVTGPTLIGGWIVFTFLGFLGMMLHYKAFGTAFPDGNRRLFMLLIFFAPTLVMWTNTVGKDALVAFFLGMFTYGVANLYRRGLGLRALLWTLAGLGGATLVRPHVGAMLVVGLTVAVALQPVRAGVLSPFIRLAALAGVVALTVMVVRTSASFINLEDLSVEGVTTFVQERGEGTQQGSLAFQGGFPRSPKDAGLAIVTVLFRPFPWEAGNPLILATSLEGLGLLGLLLYRIRSVWRAIAGSRRNSYLAFALSFIVLFIIFFSTISNFGILIRQRAQLLPFVFVWLAFQGSRAGSGSERDGTSILAA
jgi:hypothetical protein